MKKLVALIRFGLWNTSVPAELLPADDDEWQALFDESQQQAVTALLYDAILKLPKKHRPKRRVLFHFTSMTQTIEQDNRQREEALLHFASLLQSELPVPIVVVKGSSLSCHYPNSLHRECGDNDLYTGDDTEKVAQLMEKWGIAVDRKDPRHISFSFENVTFECHSYLLYHNDDIEWHTVPFSALRSSLSVLRSGESAFFLAKHTEHHSVFFHKAVPLRSLLDWCLLLGSDGFDHKSFADIKRGTDVDVFADLMSSYCNSLFGLHLPCDEKSLVDKGLVPDDFEQIYMCRTERARLAAVRVVRRSWKYLRYGRQYRAIYGRSMFRRFYLRNIRIALKNKM